MLRFLSLSLMLFVAVLGGFIYGRSDQSEKVAVATVTGVCRLADTEFGRHYIHQDQIDNVVRNLADLFWLDPVERDQLAYNAANATNMTPCDAALAQLHSYGTGPGREI